MLQVWQCTSRWGYQVIANVLTENFLGNRQVEVTLSLTSCHNSSEKTVSAFHSHACSNALRPDSKTGASYPLLQVKGSACKEFSYKLLMPLSPHFPYYKVVTHRQAKKKKKQFWKAKTWESVWDAHNVQFLWAAKAAFRQCSASINVFFSLLTCTIYP